MSTRRLASFSLKPRLSLVNWINEVQSMFVAITKAAVFCFGYDCFVERVHYNFEAFKYQLELIRWWKYSLVGDLDWYCDNEQEWS